ncbi:MAG: methyl-accepting chemotaxis protein, partial [Acidobacteria bacterium]|nr:methyl-accepting chemotaxis protein [Acidobacteriota bacterium]
MNNNFKERIKNLLFGSIRNQIITIIVLISFLLSLMLALVFYARAKAISLSQMEESYVSLATMVSGSAVYDIQFNKKAIPELAKRMIESDKNILWVEFVDSSDSLIAGYGPLKKSISEQNIIKKEDKDHSSDIVSTQMVSTAMGDAMLVVGAIQGKMEAPQESPEFGFAPTETASGKTSRLGEVRIVVGLNAISSIRKSYLLLAFVLLIIATFTGGAFAYAFSNYLLRSFRAPIELAKKVSEGDLTEYKGAFEAKGEMGQLFSAFKVMSLQLASTIRRIRDAFSKVEIDTKAVRQQLQKTMENTNKQTEATEVVANNISSIEKSIKSVAEHMEGLAGLAEEVSSSVLQMIASIDQIANSADGLTEAVNTSATTLAENSQAIKEIDASAEQINKFVEETSSAMTEMETSIRQIEQNSSSTRQSVESASQEAANGVEVVEHTASTITQLQGSFMTVAQAMKNLGKRSEEIGNILGVIAVSYTHL